MKYLILDCGCGSSEPTEEEFERIIKEVEENETPRITPIKPLTPFVLPFETEEDEETVEEPVELERVLVFVR